MFGNKNPRKFRIRFLVMLAVVLQSPSLRAAYGPVARIAPARFAIENGGHTLYAPYIASGPIDQSNPKITRLICLQHGAARNPFSYLDGMTRAMEMAGVEDETIAVAFQWLEEKDIEAHRSDHSLRVDDLLYYSSDWRAGNDSLSTSDNPRPFQISNFEVIDRFLLECAKRFPNLKAIVVTGHSAGGQIANRYAISNLAEPKLTSEFGVALQYVIYNPSSYMYLDEKRWSESEKGFAVPSRSVRRAIPDYNSFKYGFDGSNSYFKRSGKTAIHDSFPDRRVTYAIGEKDNDPAHKDLDRSPSAMLQGDSRLSRGMRYYQHLEDVFGPKIAERQRVVILPDVGHHAGDCFTAPLSLEILFGVVTSSDDLIAN